MGLKVYSAAEGNMSLNERYYLSSEVRRNIKAVEDKWREDIKTLREQGPIGSHKASAVEDCLAELERAMEVE